MRKIINPAKKTGETFLLFLPAFTSKFSMFLLILLILALLSYLWFYRQAKLRRKMEERLELEMLRKEIFRHEELDEHLKHKHTRLRDLLVNLHKGLEELEL